MITLSPYKRNVVFPAGRFTPDGRTSVIRSFGGAVNKHAKHPSSG
jgi:hypothetical protein